MDEKLRCFVFHLSLEYLVREEILIIEKTTYKEARPTKPPDSKLGKLLQDVYSHPTIFILLPWLHREVVHDSTELSHHLHTSVWGA